MESIEHFCDNRGDQNTSYIEIWEKIKLDETFYLSAVWLLFWQKPIFSFLQILNIISFVNFLHSW